MNTQEILKKVRQYPLVFTAGAVSVLLLLVLVFRLGAISDQEQRVQELEDQVLKMGRNVENSRDLTAHLERLKAVNTQIDQSLLNPDNKAANLDYFYSQEEQTGVVISRVSQEGASRPDPKQKDAKPPKGAPNYSLYQPVTFDVTADGAFRDIIKFIHRISSDRYLAKVSSVQINIRQGQGETPSTLTSNIVVEMLAPAPEGDATKKP